MRAQASGDRRQSLLAVSPSADELIRLTRSGRSRMAHMGRDGLPSFLWTRETYGVTGAEECRCVRKRVPGRSVGPTNLSKPTEIASTFERCAGWWRWLPVVTTPGFRSQSVSEPSRTLGSCG